MNLLTSQDRRYEIIKPEGTPQEQRFHPPSQHTLTTQSQARLTSLLISKENQEDYRTLFHPLTFRVFLFIWLKPLQLGLIPTFPASCGDGGHSIGSTPWIRTFCSLMTVIKLPVCLKLWGLSLSLMTLLLIPQCKIKTTRITPLETFKSATVRTDCYMVDAINCLVLIAYNDQRLCLAPLMFIADQRWGSALCSPISNTAGQWTSGKSHKGSSSFRLEVTFGTLSRLHGPKQVTQARLTQGGREGKSQHVPRREPGKYLVNQLMMTRP